MLLKGVIVYGYWPIWNIKTVIKFLYNLKYFQTISMNVEDSY